MNKKELSMAKLPSTLTSIGDEASDDHILIGGQAWIGFIATCGLDQESGSPGLIKSQGASVLVCGVATKSFLTKPGTRMS